MTAQDPLARAFGMVSDAHDSLREAMRQFDEAPTPLARENLRQARDHALACVHYFTAEVEATQPGAPREAA